MMVGSELPPVPVVGLSGCRDARWAAGPGPNRMRRNLAEAPVRPVIVRLWEALDHR